MTNPKFKSAAKSGTKSHAGANAAGAASLPEAELQMIPLNKLVLSPKNVRKTPATEAQDAELYASIKETGLKRHWQLKQPDNALWRAVDLRGQLIDFRLTIAGRRLQGNLPRGARRNANAARAFMRQASDTVRCYQPVTIVTDKAHSYAKVIEEMNYRNGPDDHIRHVDRKHLNNRIEADHAALKQLLRPNRSFRKLTSAENTLKGIETHRAIKKGHFANNKPGVLNEIAFVADLFKIAA